MELSLENKRWEIELTHVDREIHDTSEKLEHISRETKLIRIQNEEELSKLNSDLEIELKHHSKAEHYIESRTGEIARLKKAASGPQIEVKTKEIALVPEVLTQTIETVSKTKPKKQSSARP